MTWVRIPGKGSDKHKTIFFAPFILKYRFNGWSSFPFWTTSGLMEINLLMNLSRLQLFRWYFAGFIIHILVDARFRMVHLSSHRIRQIRMVITAGRVDHCLLRLWKPSKPGSQAILSYFCVKLTISRCPFSTVLWTWDRNLENRYRKRKDSGTLTKPSGIAHNCCSARALALRLSSMDDCQTRWYNVPPLAPMINAFVRTSWTS
jgi:hypothetical protein